MNEIYTDIITADARVGLLMLPDESVDMCVTSPPYYGLRAYSTDKQHWQDGAFCELGHEATLWSYVAHLVEVFQEVHRVLKPEGTLWLNLGDSYAGSGKGQMGDGSHSKEHGTKQGTSKGTLVGGLPASTDLPAKNLMGVPWRVAFALQDDGWILRNDNIWHKTNPMPGSQKDRFTTAHEYVFLFSKSRRYYFDMDSILEPVVTGYAGSTFTKGKTAVHEDGRASVKPRADYNTRTPRDVWSLPTQPYKGAHFATFPPKLIEPCILAGCPEGGIVLDPFLGSGTTAKVANDLGRNCIGIELNEEYAEMAVERLA